MPYKDFVASKQLTTGEIEQYLMSQAIITCTQSTRPTPARVGMHIWESDTQSEKFWDGTNWVFLRGLNIFRNKTSDESLASSTTMQDDDVLQATIPVNSIYVMECFIVMSSNNTEDFKLAFDVPAGCLANWTHYAPGTTQTDADHSTIGFGNFIPGTTATLGGFGNAGRIAFRVRGIINNTTPSGTLKMRWAQGSSSASATIVRTDSYLYLRKVG